MASLDSRLRGNDVLSQMLVGQLIPCHVKALNALRFRNIRGGGNGGTNSWPAVKLYAASAF